MKNENHQFFKKAELLIADQCLADFVKWLPTFFVNHYGWVAETLDAYEHFHKLPFAMRSGVFLQFFREKGIDIEVTKWAEAHRETEDTRTNKYYWIVYVDNEFKSLDCECKTYEMQCDYNTALTEAIKQANEIYNKEK